MKSNDLGVMDVETIEREFEAWWESDGQYCRAGGGSYEKTFAFQAYESAIAKANTLHVKAQTAGYTAVDMTTAAAQGFRDGQASVVIELPALYPRHDADCDVRCASFNNGVLACREAIIAAGWSVKE